jgi:uncharacterized membrane protein (DUF373 family)
MVKRLPRNIIQAKVVILIALLAVVRKVIVVDLYEATPASVAALAGLVLSLGGPTAHGGAG